jgi:D-arabinose 1-dehydrogenase-like Zn-dependent alcohol dehydrogenase
MTQSTSLREMTSLVDRYHPDDVVRFVIVDGGGRPSRLHRSDTVIPQTMRAAVTTGFGGPEMLEVRDDVSVPKVVAGEALIEVSACCCNNSDIWLREGAYGREDDPEARSGWLRGAKAVEFPLIQGADIVGRVAAVGAGVDQELVGSRVLVDHTLHSDDSEEPYGIAGIVGSERDGGFAEFATAPAANLGVIDSEMSDVGGCCPRVCLHGDRLAYAFPRRRRGG